MRSLPLLIVLALSSALVVPVTSGGGAAGFADDTTAWNGTDAAVATPMADDPNVNEPKHAAITPQQGATDTVAANVSNRTRILAVPDAAIQRTEIDRATLSLGPSTRLAGNISAVRMETAAVERYVTALDDEDEQSRRIIESFSTVEQEVITLRGRQQAAIEAFNSGEITPREFVIELATIAARADALEDRVTMLDNRAKDIEGFSLSRADQITFELRAFGGPVRERAVDAIQGTEPATRFFVTTGPEGYELTTIDNGVYVREAFRGAVRSGDASARIAPTTAINITKRGYPAIASSGSMSASVSGMTSIVTVSSENRSLTALVDSGTERVFKEYQRIPVATFRSGPAARNVLNGLRITVNRTYPGGPIRIHVVEAETGNPVNLVVTLSQGSAEGIEIGRTGEDGTLWTLSPRGSYTVTAVGEETATATFIETNSTEAPAI
ncbi:MAG: hypothetical protein V5A38_04620 [Halolamina sp.]|uniref:DUF7094 domain-containing protein n=1 Tax=Halolamina sp. TaxID=1940283 RepID=UPI002FC28BAE